MPLFIASALLLLLLATAAVVFPLLRKMPSGEAIGGGEANLDILRDQLAELDADLRNGVISPDQHEVARMEIERRVLDESQRDGAEARQGQAAVRRWLAPALTIAVLPAAAIALYLQIGSTEGLDVEAYVQRQASEITPEKVEQMTRQLAQHLEENPDDAEGWVMLGRAYKALQEFDASARAWARAAQLQPDDADVLTDYAEVLGLAAQGDLAGEPTRLLARALQLDPAQSKALALGGSAAFGREDYAAAIDHWQKLLVLSAADEQLSDALRTGIAEAQARLGQASVPAGQVGDADADASVAIAGTVSLSAELAQSAASGDTVFVFARAADGPGMPLAALRVQAGELPYRFRLDDSMAIMPGRKMSDAPQLVIGARISKSGVATRNSGDLEGFSIPVEAGANDVRVVIDQRVP
jgi:cytochrome c-type biogenesis protein CcmH